MAPVFYASTLGQPRFIELLWRKPVAQGLVLAIAADLFWPKVKASLHATHEFVSHPIHSPTFGFGVTL